MTSVGPLIPGPTPDLNGIRGDERVREEVVPFYSQLRFPREFNSSYNLKFCLMLRIVTVDFFITLLLVIRGM